MSAYYDRSLPEPLFRLIRPDGGLHWLIDWQHSPRARARHARVDFRRNDDGHKRGAIMVYLGRTHPLMFVGQAGGAVKIDAAPSYKVQRRSVFGKRPASRMLALQPELQTWLEECRVSEQYVAGEGGLQGAFTRRYTSNRSDDEPLVVDSEIQVGHAGGAGRTGTDVRETTMELRRAEHPLFAGSAPTPTKLDALAILQTGALAVIELKKDRGDLRQAAVQAAGHMFTLPRLGEVLTAGVDRLVAQKAECRLFGGRLPRRSATGLIPVIAAPDSDPDWAARWRRDTADIRSEAPQLLAGLRLWRLSNTGEIAEDVLA